ncbi:MAG: SWIM zinc finger family protein [Candidatus Woesearchaeota archaeon]
MNIQKFEDHYKVKSESSNRWYEVFPDRPFCTCPSFIFYSTKKGGVCKHIKAVQEQTLKVDPGVVDYVRQKGEVDSLQLIEKFGEEKVNACIASGELLESKGRIKLL